MFCHATRHLRPSPRLVLVELRFALLLSESELPVAAAMTTVNEQLSAVREMCATLSGSSGGQHGHPGGGADREEERRPMTWSHTSDGACFV